MDIKTSLLASCSQDGLKIWEVTSGGSEVKLVSTLKPHSKPIKCIHWNDKGTLLASGGLDGRVFITTLHPTPNVIQTVLDQPGLEPRCLAFHPNSQFLAVGYLTSIDIYDLASTRVILKIQKHSAKITCLAFNPEGTNILSGAENGEFFLNNLTNNTTVTEMAANAPTIATSGVRALQYSRKAKDHALTGHENGSVAYWDLPSCRAEVIFRHHNAPVVDVALSPVHPALAISVSLDGQLVFYDVVNKSTRRTVNLPSTMFSSLSYMVDGKTITAGTSTGTLLVFSIAKEADPTMISQKVDHAHLGEIFDLQFQNFVITSKPTPAGHIQSKSSTIEATTVLKQVKAEPVELDSHRQHSHDHPFVEKSANVLRSPEANQQQRLLAQSSVGQNLNVSKITASSSSHGGASTVTTLDSAKTITTTTTNLPVLTGGPSGGYSTTVTYRSASVATLMPTPSTITTSSTTAACRPVVTISPITSVVNTKPSTTNTTTTAAASVRSHDSLSVNSTTNVPTTLPLQSPGTLETSSQPTTQIFHINPPNATATIKTTSAAITRNSPINSSDNFTDPSLWLQALENDTMDLDHTNVATTSNRQHTPPLNTLSLPTALPTTQDYTGLSASQGSVHEISSLLSDLKLQTATYHDVQGLHADMIKNFLITQEAMKEVIKPLIDRINSLEKQVALLTRKQCLNSI